MFWIRFLFIPFIIFCLFVDLCLQHPKEEREISKQTFVLSDCCVFVECWKIEFLLLLLLLSCLCIWREKKNRYHHHSSVLCNNQLDKKQLVYFCVVVVCSIQIVVKTWKKSKHIRMSCIWYFFIFFLFLIRRCKFLFVPFNFFHFHHHHQIHNRMIMWEGRNMLLPNEWVKIDRWLW